MPTLKKTVCLINKDITNFEILIDAILDNNYFINDKNIHLCRHRGTLLRKNKNEIEVLGWQRNIMSSQNVEYSFPNIITMKIDQDLIIRSVDLHNSYRGSQGLICNYQHLLNALKVSYVNKKIDDNFFRKISLEALPCFHLVQVVAGILSSFQIFQERNLEYLFEEEATDAYPNGKDLVFIGSQRMSFVNNPVSYAIVFRGGIDAFRIQETGSICADKPLLAEFYVNDKKISVKEFNAMDEKLLDTKIKVFFFESLNEIKNVFTQDKLNSFICSNLFPSAIKGFFVISLAWNLYHNNLSLLNHYTRKLRRDDTMPRCIGAIDSVDEAKQYYPRLYEDIAVYARLFK